MVFSSKISNEGLTWGQETVGSYFVDFLDNGDRLIVTFESSHPINNPVWPDGGRLAWGMKFLAKAGFSVLGVKAIYNDWYRGAELQDLFEALAREGFFERFSQITFYGGSMGGFGALSLSATVPGSTIIALNPQSSLDPEVVPWEDRFTEGRAAGWTGPLADAAVTSLRAAKIWVCYDPFLQNDVRHIRRLPSDKLIELKLPGVGHSTPIALSRMGLLNVVLLDIVNGGMTASRFAHLSRCRRDMLAYWIFMSGYLTKHPQWQKYFSDRAFKMRKEAAALKEMQRIQKV